MAGEEVSSRNQCLYIFLDEAGDFNFSPTGTRYFVLTSLTKRRPFEAYKALTELKYDLIEFGIDLEYFHASEDLQATRNRVFEIITRHLAEVRLDSLIVEKSKANPNIHVEVRFYPEMLGHLLKDVLRGVGLESFRELIVVTDRIPVSRKREAVEKAVKQTLAELLPKEVRYQVLHHASKSNLDLQIVDYCNWAIYRKWGRQDSRSYQVISSAVKGELDIFSTEAVRYY